MSTTVSLTELGAPGTTAAPATRPTAFLYDPAQDREKVRGQVALVLTWCLVGIVTAMTTAGLATTVWCLHGGDCTDATLELKAIASLATMVLTPLVGLVGAVTGFYFGEKAARVGE